MLLWIKKRLPEVNSTVATVRKDRCLNKIHDPEGDIDDAINELNKCEKVRQEQLNRIKQQNDKKEKEKT